MINMSKFNNNNNYHILLSVNGWINKLVKKIYKFTTNQKMIHHLTMLLEKIIRNLFWKRNHLSWLENLDSLIQFNLSLNKNKNRLKKSMKLMKNVKLWIHLLHLINLLSRIDSNWIIHQTDNQNYKLMVNIWRIKERVGLKDLLLAEILMINNKKNN